MLSSGSTQTNQDRTTTSSSSPSYQASSSAEAIANNDDLLLEILIHLPVRSLLKFKSVSKTWLSMICSPNFYLHLRLVPKPITGLFLPLVYKPGYEFINLSSNPSPFECLSFGNSPSKINILQSCNGLLLCRCQKANVSNPNNSFDYFVYNPTTNQKTTLPPLPLDTGVYCAGVNLAFDPSKSPYYEVICVKDLDHDDSYEIEIYSSKTRTWRQSECTFIVPFHMYYWDCVFWNGAIYWFNSWQQSLYFKVDEGKVREMPMPPLPDGWYERRFGYFGESQGHLHLIENYSPCSALFNVYEMEKDYAGWFVKYHVDLRAVVDAFPDMVWSYRDPGDTSYYKFSTLCVVRVENDEESYLVVTIPKKVISYNFNDKTFKKIHDLGSRVFMSAFGDESPYEYALDFIKFKAFQHIESLASVR